MPALAQIAREALPSEGWSERSFSDEFGHPERRCLVAAEGEDVRGYLIYWIIQDEGHILQVACEPSHRRKGVAASLVQACMQEGLALGIRSFFLEVRASNAAALALYRRFGFEKIGERKRFYDHPVEDAVVMTWAPGGART